MNNIKIIARSLVVLGLLGSVGVNGESYVVQPGDMLSTIAQKKILSSTLPINLQQVMLTIYKFNPDAFDKGDVDHIVPGKQLFIPDNLNDFIPISKSDALIRIRDKAYLNGLYSSVSALKLSGDSTPGKSIKDAAGYSQIQQILEDHQQNINQLKMENAELSKSFKLLERAMGRIVIVQGLLTNDVVKVKTKLFGGTLSASAPVVDGSQLVVNNSVGGIKASDNQGNSDVAKIETVIPTVTGPSSSTNLISTGSGESANQAPLNQSVNNSVMPAVAAIEAPKVPGNLAPESISSNPESGMGNYLIIGLAVGFPVLLLLLWFIDFRQLRTKFRATKTAENVEVAPKNSLKDRLMSSDNSRYGVDDPKFNDVSEELVAIKIDKPVRENGLADSITELGGVMELLDMCLLCGDYQQAHAVALKAVADNQSSPIISKKLAMIERKLSKH